MGFKSDIEIAQETELKDVRDIAAKMGLTEVDIELTESTRQRWITTSEQIRRQRWQADTCYGNQPYTCM